MPDKDEQEGVVTLEQLQQQMAQLEADRDALRGDVESLRARNTGLEQIALESFIGSIVTKATSYRDTENRAHSVVFLEWLQKVLTCSDVGEGDAVIQLAQDADPKSVHAYYRKAAAWLAENMPGSGPLMDESGTEGEDRRLDNTNGTGDGDDEKPLTQEQDEMLDDVWAIMPAEGGE